MASRLKALVFGMSALIVASAGTVALAQMSGEQVVKEREALMKRNSADNKIVAAAVKSGQIDAKVAKAAQEISDSAKKLPSLFPPGTGDDKLRTRAKPAIWKEQSKFLGYAKDLETGFAEVASAAKSGDAKAMTAAFKKASQTCGACHKEFRGPALK
jgi:cytochrome c556